MLRKTQWINKRPNRSSPQYSEALRPKSVAILIDLFPIQAHGAPPRLPVFGSRTRKLFRERLLARGDAVFPKLKRSKAQRNAAAAAAGPFRGVKRSLYEDGIPTPLVVRWPGRVPAVRVDNETAVGGVDFLPTVCRLAGVNPPASALRDGEDMSNAWMGKVRRRTRPLLWENRFPVYGHVLDMSPMLAIRDSPWKILINPDRSRVE